MTDIWLADVARAIAAVDPTAEERVEIMHMLAGTRPVAALSARQRLGETERLPTAIATHLMLAAPAEPIVTDEPATSNAEVEPGSPPAPPPPATQERAKPAVEHGRRSLPPLGSFRHWLSARKRFRVRGGDSGPDELKPAGRQMADPVVDECPTMPRRDETSPMAIPAIEPLLATRSTRAIIWHLLSQRVDDGSVDVAAAVTLLVNQQPLRTIPRVARHTLRFGARLLVDRSDSMRPLSQDQRQMLHAVRHLVGGGITDVQYFVGSPLRGVTDRPVGRPRRYVPPSRGVPVLLLTDFGLRRYLNCAPGAPPQEWEAFLRQHTALNRPTALVPFRTDRTPAWLSRWCQVVTWDRTTTANAVRTGRR